MFVIQQQERNWTKMVFMGEPQGKKKQQKTADQSPKNTKLDILKANAHAL